MASNKALVIRPIKDEDLPILWELMFKDKSPEWKKWDAPYYEHRALAWEDYLETWKNRVNQDDRWVIEVGSKVIGTVSYYWEHKPSNWLEMGIGIYDHHYWSGGCGTKALSLWIDHLFDTLPLVRVGFATWSGNHRMIRVGEKLGMQLEGRLRKCRYYNGTYYDSIRMGLLREEWEEVKERIFGTLFSNNDGELM
ncbi:acetyltransferase [Alicyclobacillus acidoterrestris]|uniref:GNAT family N-acetyltransferase n=1 Tax=Alicyclobacillus suci TaxID=2816080 RepID=UPI0011951E53|nr:GNAT family protein [Alicyclobacillus suci]GEO28112.1 acetyltransferase [Alicyclobacillus acidoterrestris]